MISAVAMAVGLATMLLVYTFAVDRGASEREVARSASIAVSVNSEVRPVNESPNWRQLSKDLGVLLREDPHLGTRGTLFVRIDGVWKPVAIDGTDDLAGMIPAQ